MFCTRKDNNNVEDRRGGGRCFDLFKHPPAEARLAGGDRRTTTLAHVAGFVITYIAERRTLANVIK